MCCPVRAARLLAFPFRGAGSIGDVGISSKPRWPHPIPCHAWAQQRAPPDTDQERKQQKKRPPPRAPSRGLSASGKGRARSPRGAPAVTNDGKPIPRPVRSSPLGWKTSWWALRGRRGGSPARPSAVRRCRQGAQLLGAGGAVPVVGGVERHVYHAAAAMRAGERGRGGREGPRIPRWWRRGPRRVRGEGWSVFSNPRHGPSLGAMPFVVQGPMPAVAPRGITARWSARGPRRCPARRGRGSRGRGPAGRRRCPTSSGARRW